MTKRVLRTLGVGVCMLAAAITTERNTGAAGATIVVNAGGSLQAAIDQAAPGDTILVEAGATFVGNFVLPVKSGDAHITIRSSAPDSLLPPAGTRITPAFAPYLPKLKSPNNMPSLRTKGPAHHYRLLFLEFLANYNGSGEMMQLGQASSAQTDLSQVPYDLVVDRVYMHGDPLLGQKRGISLNSARTDIVNSYISEIKAVAIDGQPIAALNGPGPYLIENNYLEGAGENFLAGGADPMIPNLTPSDMVFRHNHFTKPLSWRDPIVPTPEAVVATGSIEGGTLTAGTYSYRVVAFVPAGIGGTARSDGSAEVSTEVASGATGSVSVTWQPVANATSYRVYGRTPGAIDQFWTTTAATFVDTGVGGTAGTVAWPTRWMVKNVFELKNARNVLVEGNVIENSWQAGQRGYAIVLTPRNSGKTCTWCAVENVEFRYNLIRHAAGGINVLGYDNTAPSGQARDLRFVHNLAYDMDKTRWGGWGWFLLMGAGPANVTIDHNTVRSVSNASIYAYGGTTSDPTEIYGLRLTNNLLDHGIDADYFDCCMTTINAYYPDGVITHNVLAGEDPSQYPAGQWFPAAADHEAQFVNPAADDLSLVGGSPYRNAGTDGLDLGADIEKVQKAAVIALSGNSRLRITTLGLPDARRTYPYSATLEASGVAVAPTWRIIDGSLPTGMSLDATTGTISGKSGYNGCWTFTVRVEDAADPSNSDQKAFRLVVRTKLGWLPACAK